MEKQFDFKKFEEIMKIVRKYAPRGEERVNYRWRIPEYRLKSNLDR